QDRVLGALDRTRDGDATVELAQRLPFAADPEGALEPPPVPRLLVQSHALAALLDELPVAVDRLVAEVPPIERVVQLERNQLLAGRPRVGTEQVDARLLAVLQRFQMCFDESFVEEVLERFVS